MIELAGYLLSMLSALIMAGFYGFTIYRGRQARANTPAPAHQAAGVYPQQPVGYSPPANGYPPQNQGY